MLHSEGYVTKGSLTDSVRKREVNQKTGCLNIQKKKPSVRVELRAGGDLHRSEKPRWSAGDMRPLPKNDA